jgi:penicillin V acylase-like amidase (Ntn superfamily)
MKQLRAYILVILFLLLLPVNAYTCTTFCFQDSGEWIYGRNYDWMVEYCLVTVNKRGVAKTAATEDNPAQWVSKYGSITFNQYGRELPLGGMNEEGLVVELMWLEETEYPHPDTRKAVTDLQWVQYQLDNAATVADVIASDKAVRIAGRNATPIHFLVCDRTGQAATIEFLSGKMVVHTQETLPVTALTNNTYAYSLRLFNMFHGNETSEAFDAADYSLKRFVWAANGVQNWDSQTHDAPVDYAFSILEKTSVGRTVFRIVYDVGNKRIYFRTKSNPAQRYIDFDAFDYSCTTPVRILDIAAGEGDVTDDFVDYSYETNYDLISKSYAETPFLGNMSEETKQWIAKYPETLPCEE